MGKSRAAAFAVGLQDIDEGDDINIYSEYSDSDLNESSQSEGNIVEYSDYNLQVSLVAPLLYLNLKKNLFHQNFCPFVSKIFIDSRIH